MARPVGVFTAMLILFVASMMLSVLDPWCLVAAAGAGTYASGMVWVNYNRMKRELTKAITPLFADESSKVLQTPVVKMFTRCPWLLTGAAVASVNYVLAAAFRLGSPVTARILTSLLVDDAGVAAPVQILQIAHAVDDLDVEFGTGVSTDFSERVVRTRHMRMEPGAAAWRVITDMLEEADGFED